MVVLLLSLFGSTHSYVIARNYIRLNADFSYVRDCSRANTGAPFIENVSLDETLGWVGHGRAESLSQSNGFAPGVGIGYRYTHKWLLVDVGLGAEYRYRINRPYDIVEVKADAVDNTNLPYTGYHTWNGRETRMQHIGVSVPVMAGAEWKSLYAMVGFKANVDVWGMATEKGAYTLKGDYERFMDPLVNIPEHGFVQNEPYELSSSASIGWDVRVCAEIGYCLNGQSETRISRRKAEIRYYVGAFVEYGFIGAASRYQPLLAGIRLTALLPIPERKHCNCLGY